MSTSVLPQLLEVDSELTAQASQLEARLTELQEKRKGIQTVISMFESGDGADMTALTAATKPTSRKKTAAKTAGKKTAGRKASADSKAKTTQAKTTKTKTTKTKTTKAKRGRPAKAKSTTASKKATATTAKATTKRSGRKANWQRYVQENYRKSSLPDVVVGVLQAQPTSVFKIADVMNAVFKEDMPKNHFLKARNRISNILSAGARDGVWHRGRGGTYSMSEKAIKAS